MLSNFPQKICPTCNGERTVWQMIECGRSMSDCCGGCTRDVTCDECNGRGTVDDVWDPRED